MVDVANGNSSIGIIPGLSNAASYEVIPVFILIHCFTRKILIFYCLLCFNGLVPSKLALK